MLSQFRELMFAVVLTAGAIGVAIQPACASSETPLAERFQAHIEYLADDKLTGRGVGTPGIEKAAEYIANQLSEIGVEPAGEDGTFFQTLTVTLHRELTEDSTLEITGADDKLKLGEDFTPFSFSSNEEFGGGVVFCGYGIVSPDHGYDDFANVDVEGKVALLLRGEPATWSAEAGRTTHHAMFRNKVYNAKDRGAVAVIIFNQEPGEGETDALFRVDASTPDDYGIPAFHVTRAVADGVLKRGGLDSPTDLQKRLDRGESASAALGHVMASGRAGFNRETTETRNVIGKLRGYGPDADEYVVIGGHYDHLGVSIPMSRTFKDGKLAEAETQPQIHNGADDNASGIAGIIEIARLLKEKKPNRSAVFIAFTAEESGLHGSKYFVDNPTIPLDRVSAMLNLDMVGRLDASKNEVQIFGAPSGEEFGEFVEVAAKKASLKTAPSPDTGGRSDHAPFIRKGIPAMHFFSGHHPDYHKPSDDAYKINAEGGARITYMVADIAASVANMDGHVKFKEMKRPKPTPAEEGGGTPTYRVVMGLAPSYGEDGKPGMGVDGVNAEGPADLAGMKAGDRIVEIGGKEVTNIYDYMAATRNNKAGDIVDVIVLRGEEKITLKVKLAAAR